MKKMKMTNLQVWVCIDKTNSCTCTEEDWELINYVWDEVGEDYEKEEILDGLDQVDWDPEEAIRVLKKSKNYLRE